MSKIYGLVIIDMSQEQLFPNGDPILPKWKGYSNILALAQAIPDERVFDSRLWISDSDASTLSILYPNVGRANTEGAKLVSELKDLRATFVKKIQYSAFFGSELNQLLKSKGVTTILLTGINTNYCVFASALDAFYLGYEVCLINDACGSMDGAAGHKHGIADFERYLVTRGSVISTAEAIKLIQNSTSK